MYCCCQTDVLLAFVYEGFLMGWFTLVCCGCSPEILQSWNLNSDFFATTSCEHTKCSKNWINITFSDNGTNNETNYTKYCSSVQNSMVLTLRFLLPIFCVLFQKTCLHWDRRNLQSILKERLSFIKPVDS